MCNCRLDACGMTITGRTSGFHVETGLLPEL